MPNETTLTCPECGATMELKETLKYRYRNGQPRKFYACIMWRVTGCKGIHGADPQGRPLGIPANQETKQWRIKAHEAFDTFWKRWGLSRSDGYYMLQTIMGMSETEAHIGRFNIEQCQQLIEKIRQAELEKRGW